MRQTNLSPWCLHLGVLIEQMPGFCQDIPELVGRGFTAEANDLLEQDLVAFAVVLQVCRGRSTVRNGDQRPVERADLRGPQSDILDSADLVTHLADISHPQDIVTDHRDPAEQVLESFLSAETECDTADSYARQRSRHIHTPRPQHQYRDGNEDEGI